jgi:hypothetical protein
MRVLSRGDEISPEVVIKVDHNSERERHGSKNFKLQLSSSMPRPARGFQVLVEQMFLRSAQFFAKS